METIESYQRQRRPRKRSVAWIYYSILAAVGFVASLSVGPQPQLLIATVLCTAYAIYLFRGGRFAVWFW